MLVDRAYQPQTITGAVCLNPVTAVYLDFLGTIHQFASTSPTCFHDFRARKLLPAGDGGF